MAEISDRMSRQGHPGEGLDLRFDLLLRRGMTVRERLLLVLGTLAVGAIAIATFAQSSLADPDIWGLMAMGRETLLRGWPPTQDPFTYLPARSPVVYHE